MNSSLEALTGSLLCHDLISDISKADRRSLLVV